MQLGSMTIPEELVQRLAGGQVVLWLGPGMGDDPAAPTNLARALAAACHYAKEDVSLIRVANFFEQRQGRQALVAATKDYLDSLAADPAPVHHLLARLPLSVILTMAQDNRLDTALRHANRRSRRIVVPGDTAFMDDPEQVAIVKIMGDVENPKTLLLTEGDRYQEPALLVTDVVRSLIVTRTLLFLEDDLSDPILRQLYSTVLYRQGQFKKEAYAVLPSPASYDQDFWDGKQVHFVYQDTAAFLQELLKALDRYTQAPAVAGVVPPAIPRRPFQRLDSFTADDADRFFGRDREIRLLSQKILAHPLMVLTGPSGCGKTSLLQAGVLPALQGQGYTSLITRCGDDPLAALSQTIRRAGGTLPPEAPLGNQLVALAKQTGKQPILVMDQFEECFIQLGTDSQLRLAQELADLLDDSRLDLRIVLSLRDDFFVQLYALQRHLPTIFNNTFVLERLKPEQAREAITRPLANVGAAFTPELVDAILQDLDQEGIDPPQLQIVCDRLYDEMIAAGSKEATLALYLQLQRAEGILGGYLERVLTELPRSDQERARRLLKEMVTSRQTKLLVPMTQLLEAMGETAGQLRPLLEILVDCRLIRPGETPAGIAYELVHDYLAREVRRWLDVVDVNFKKAQELLRREMDGWRSHGLLLSLDELRLIDRQRDRLRLSDEEATLLASSAVLHDHEVDYWLGRLKDDGERLALLQGLAGAESPAARRHAAAGLARFPGPDSVNTLLGLAIEEGQPVGNDEERGRIRAQAVESLTQVGDATVVARLVAARRETPARAVAQDALVTLLDRRPEWFAGQPGALRREIGLALARRRLLENRPAIVQGMRRGAVGGAIGLGLAFSLLVALLVPGLAFLYAPVTAVWDGMLGLLAGALLGLGRATGAALFPRQPGRGALAGSSLGGAVGYGLVMALSVWFFGGNVGPAALGGAALGILLAAGTLAGRRLIPGQVAEAAGGAIAGLLGFTLLHMAGVLAFSSLGEPAFPAPLPVLGALAGAIAGASLPPPSPPR